MTTENKLEIFLKDLKQALNGFEELLKEDLSKETNVRKDGFQNGQLMKFLYTSELCWKTCMFYLEKKTGEILSSPKTVIKKMFTERLIDEALYLKLDQIINDRNHLSHRYKPTLAEVILAELPTHCKAMNELIQILEAK